MLVVVVVVIDVRMELRHLRRRSPLNSRVHSVSTLVEESGGRGRGRPHETGHCWMNRVRRGGHDRLRHNRLRHDSVTIRTDTGQGLKFFGDLRRLKWSGFIPSVLLVFILKGLEKFLGEGPNTVTGRKAQRQRFL